MTSKSSRRAAPPALLGSQEPRLCHVPKWTSTSGPEAFELCAKAGLHLDPWQQFVLCHALGEKPDGTWASPTVGLVCPRQNGKNAILEARELVGLFLLDEGVIIHSAHEQATASEQFRRLLGLIEATPQFSGRMRKTVKGKGSEAIELYSGQRILFKTRTGGGARGFSIDCIVFDECYELPESAISAMVPTLSARPNTQTWYTSSAVDQQKHQHGVALTRQRERGMAGKPGIAYFEWSAQGDDPSRVPPDIFNNPLEWAGANPSYGMRLLPEAVQREHDGDMGAREFAVERLGIGDWPSTDDQAARVIDLARWDGLVSDAPDLEGPVFLAFDVSPDRSSAAIGAAVKKADGSTHVEVVEHGRGTGWVAASIARRIETLTKQPGDVVCDAGGPAGSLVTEVEEALGRELTKLNAKEHAQAFGLFCDAVEQATVHHLGDPELRTAIDGATTRPLGEAFAWSRKTSSVDISPLVAVTLALWACRQGQGPPEIWDLNEVVARLRARRAAEASEAETQAGETSEPKPPAPEGGQRFIPLDQMPLRRW